MNILVTGGAGYIGSHVCLKLLELGNKIIVIDNFSNSHPGVLSNVIKISKNNQDLVVFKVSNRRDGDVSISYSDPSFAKLAFNWEAKYNLEDMCNDAWNYKLNNIS